MDIYSEIMQNLMSAASEIEKSISVQQTDQPLVVTIALRVGMAILVAFLAKWLARFVSHWIERILQRTTLTSSMVMVLTRLAFYGVWVLAILLALAVMGVPITGVVAALGAIGIVLGIALQESIGNFASSVIFFLFQPFKVGI